MLFRRTARVRKHRAAGGDGHGLGDVKIRPVFSAEQRTVDMVQVEG